MNGPCSGGKLLGDQGGGPWGIPAEKAREILQHWVKLLAGCPLSLSHVLNQSCELCNVSRVGSKPYHGSPE